MEPASEAPTFIGLDKLRDLQVSERKAQLNEMFDMIEVWWRVDWSVRPIKLL